MTIATKILNRMEELGIKPAVAAERLGYSVGFFSDLKRGKKRSLSAEALPKLADLLDCDVRYLLGIIENPRGDTGAQPFRLTGTINPDAWFEAGGDPWEGRVIEVTPDPRYPANTQSGFVVQHGRTGTRIPDGAVVITIPLEGPPRSGDMVVAKKEKDGFTLRVAGKYLNDAGEEPVIACNEELIFSAADYQCFARITRIVQVL